MLNADTREFEFTSDFDGLVVSAVIAAPSGNVNGVVQIVHGMNEYKERYFPFMDYLAEEGFITVIHDNRGHGKSICSPDDLGFMYRAGGKGFVSDIAQLNGIIKKRFPELPLFLIGHSMGTVLPQGPRRPDRRPCGAGLSLLQQVFRLCKKHRVGSV